MRKEFRDVMLAAVPKWYSPWGHLAGSVGVGVVYLFLGIWGLRRLAPLELLTVPIVFVILNLAEWFIHKNIMHRRRRVLAVLYDRHTPEHHRVFRADSMAIRSALELRLVLIPAAGVLGIVTLSVPAALLAGWLLVPNVGWLLLMTTAVYVVGYELSHLLYHFPEHSAPYRSRVLHTLREHHARHHDPRCMQKYNFNVTIPLGDLLFGTMAPHPPPLVNAHSEHGARRSVHRDIRERKSSDNWSSRTRRNARSFPP
ncbi:MAG: sterol desaturase family protein [Polyangiaceae bacterium]|nr:sterol desaturase family protein [Polyangiaceae bacterium]